ncbi:MAG: radical SAM protein [Omnitrophica WOR_2 bacterium GWF2_43_52]|nr:MAG: radical SAM protein [Omnitrophica WOR_2 bacterium GWF2_43_52]OGX52941.1 MAG: radical SAM protein [Omnitrophica WOR_2 bacterium RIFOXYC2_FULL_43_9]
MSNAMYPRYLSAYKDGSLKKKAEMLFSALSRCDICPRNCKVNRLENKQGFCKTGKKAKVYSYFCHHGEEPGISGTNGSGTIFFTNCNLRCVYCQNYEFSQLDKGKETGDEELASFMLELQQEGCHNVNFVTPTHNIPQILMAVVLAVEKGLKIPLVYNSSGYDSVETLRLLEGIFDIYMPDARYFDSQTASRFSQAKDYPAINQAAIKEMRHQVGVVKFSPDEIIEKGLLIRHLVLPNKLSGTEEIMAFIARELGTDTHISLMSQYFPCHKAKDYPELTRRLTLEEYQEAMNIMHSYGLYNGWTQDEQGLDRFAGIHIKSNL